MEQSINFERILEKFESCGWTLKKIHKPYRVFIKKGHLPFLIPVHNNIVEEEYVQKVNEFFKDHETKKP